MVLKNIIVSSLFLNVALLLGRLSGFVRELIIARTYGVTGEADVVILWLTLPDILLNILAGAAVGAALIPSFAANKESAKDIWLQAIMIFGVIFLLIALVLQFFSGYLVTLLAPGLATSRAVSADFGVKVSILLFPLSVLAAINSAYSHYNNNFFMAGMGTLIFNSVLIFLICLFNYLSLVNVELVVFALCMASIVRFSYQFFIIIDFNSVKSVFRECFLEREVFSRFFQAVVSSGLIFIYPVIGRSFSSSGGEGGFAAFNYMFKLLELPLMVAVTFLSVVFMPSLSKAWLTDRNLYLSLALRGTEATLFAAVFVMLPVWAYSEFYVATVFGKSLAAPVVQIIGECVKYGSFILITQGGILFLSSVFNASSNTRIPLLSNFFAIFIYVVVLKVYEIHEMLDIVKCLLFAQLISLSILCGFFYFKWQRNIRSALAARWLFSLLAFSIGFFGLNSWLLGCSEKVRLSVLLTYYVLSGFCAMWCHPVLKGFLNKILAKFFKRERHV